MAEGKPPVTSKRISKNTVPGIPDAGQEQEGQMVNPKKLPADIRAFRNPIVSPETIVSKVPSTSFGDLVRMLGESIADAQMSLDKASAEMMTELAETKVNVVRNITETVDEKGNITYKNSPPQSISLLELGMLPSFYQFSQATVEVALDLTVVENESSTEKGKKTLFANTSTIQMERKLNKDLKITSKLTATLVPVPPPIRIEPSRTTETKE